MGRRRNEERDQARPQKRIMLFVLRLSLAALLLPFSLPSVPLQSVAALERPRVVSTATREGRIIVFDDVWETVRALYYDPHLHGLDWQAERETFRAIAAEASTTEEFYATLRHMLGNLRDAHTRVFAPTEKFDWRRPRFIGVGVSVREVNNLPVIFAVEPESEAERRGLRAGDILTSIDEENVLKLFARRLREQGDSSTRAAARERALAKLFDGTSGSTVSVAWIGSDGKERKAMLKRLWCERAPALRARRFEGGRIGLVEFDIFTQEAAADFMRALDGRLRDARGLIIDLRNNGGGDSEAMIDIISALLPAGKSLGRFTDRNGRIQSEPHTRAVMLFSANHIKSFHAPLIILTSERSSSAAEIFVAALKESGRATILGQNTCGCALGLRRRHTLPDGGELHISELDYHTAGGTRLEGTGVAPDEKITLDRRDLRARRDRAMERAVELLTVETRSR